MCLLDPPPLFSQLQNEKGGEEPLQTLPLTVGLLTYTSHETTLGSTTIYTRRNLGHLDRPPSFWESQQSTKGFRPMTNNIIRPKNNNSALFVICHGADCVLNASSFGEISP